ncbi:type II toxin-antitoxin system PemK/MazF family toxin [Intrasporangium chromatireducens]|uniref:type II toxin-antitoxin system PemK/MazF family toxin n=1 Tax=Intrasporangium chromatireducens TaxID=1386088 RepID=UPI003B82EA62
MIARRRAVAITASTAALLDCWDVRDPRVDAYSAAPDREREDGTLLRGNGGTGSWSSVGSPPNSWTPPATPHCAGRRVVIRRGEIHWTDLGDPQGSRPAKRRPTLVIQSAPYNDSRLATALTAVISLNAWLAVMSGNVFLCPRPLPACSAIPS